MARLPRLTVPGRLHYVIQRGNNGQAIFIDDEDRELLLSLLQRFAVSLNVAVHAYLLMPESVSLLVTPQDADGVPKLMQSVGRAYVRAFNARHGRTGTLWEGRYRSTVLQPERYLVAAMAAMDLAPLQQHLAGEPAGYRWSSHAHYAGQRSDRLLTPHAIFWSMGDTPFARERAYLQRLEGGSPAAEQQVIADAVVGGWALGDDAFLAALQRETPRRLVKGRAGRPAKA